MKLGEILIMKESEKKLLYKLMRLEIKSFSTFSNIKKEDWGVYFYNPEYTERHDANHALILDPGQSDPYSKMIQDITDYYQSRDLTPRINFYHPNKKHPFKKELAKQGYVTPIYYSKEGRPTKIMTYDKHQPTPPQLPSPANAMLFNTNAVDPDGWLGKDIYQLLQPDQPYQRVIQDKNYNYFVLYVDGEAVSVMSCFTDKKMRYGRIDDVYTKEEHRTKGYMTYLLHYALNWILKKYNAYLEVYDDHAFRMYKQAGFTTQFECFYSHWHLPE